MLRTIAFVVGSTVVVLAGIGIYVLMTDEDVSSPPDPQDSTAS